MTASSALGDVLAGSRRTGAGAATSAREPADRLTPRFAACAQSSAKRHEHERLAPGGALHPKELHPGRDPRPVPA